MVPVRFRAVSTHAKRDGDSWIINASKVLISYFEGADGVVVFVRTASEKGAKGISMFAAERDNPGLIARPLPMLGGIKTHQLTFDNCRVDDVGLMGKKPDSELRNRCGSTSTGRRSAFLSAATK
ncbi:hypothetical protein CWO91_37620 [Bradyrhizobium genosp. SA-3]|uniref:acyl-CoA dehydrogenase family protein n=1 Tax=Bradyrhizobium genosp. SA-3 TaxID=508868 RepID=UPI001028AA00|nr:acyl-CoA dehydrogenase family protein [Bradyrhizobium genosp. SA-3]RZM97387.1 hypothetical protein CWO91_37620 [Bradyrhizobium genosp. SA-3]